MGCKKFVNCMLIDMLCEHEMLDFQYVEGVKKLCGNCKDKEEDNKEVVDLNTK